MSAYTVVFEQADDGGWSAYSPDVAGVVAAADSREDVEVRMREALGLYRGELAHRGQQMPEPRADVAVIEV